MGWALTGAGSWGLPEVARRGLHGTADKPGTPDLGAMYVCGGWGAVCAVSSDGRAGLTRPGRCQVRVGARPAGS